LKIAVLGAGAWGSALSISLAQRHDVVLWMRDAAAAAELARTRVSRYLPELPLPALVAVEPDLARALDSDLALVATSTAGLESIARAVAATGKKTPLVWACKGFDASGRMPHETVAEALPGLRRVGALSGPSFALEVAQGLPAALVLASHDADFAREMAAMLNGPRLRLYSSADVVGVELGGAVKNVIAIAAGIADGLGLGRNARAALVTRGLAEIVRLGTACGGHPETFMGLAGLGDLVLTCTGDLSRNRRVGMRLADGVPLASVLAELGHVAEGVASAAAVRELALRHGTEMPISEAVNQVLFQGLAPGLAVQRLLARDPRSE
jgi:glycerol-3-phosphate dehydrogenase (NAD(P)+)